MYKHIDIVMHLKVSMYKRIHVKHVSLIKKTPHFPLLFTWDGYYCSARAGCVIINPSC